VLAIAIAETLIGSLMTIAAERDGKLRLENLPGVNPSDWTA
jgi:hypothetical protein